MHDAQHLRGWCQNITAFKGDSVSFPGRPFKEICEVAFLGKEKSENNTRDVFYSHGPELPDLPFDSYKGRLEIRTNCSSILKNVQPEDEGWYFLKWDLDQTASVYLRVTDNPQENGHSVTIVVVIIVVCAILLLIGLAIWRGLSQNLTAVIGGYVYFQGRPFERFCEWDYNGELKTNNGKPIINKHAPDNQHETQQFDPYRNRIELHRNCTLLLKNIQVEDKGWYLLKIDLEKELLWYNLDVLDVSQNLTAVIGHSVHLPGRPFKSSCEWEYNGDQKTKNNGKTIINVYVSNNQEVIKPSDPYANRTELHLNCTLLLKNIQLEDKGWYLLKIDLDKELLWYNLDVIGNGKSLTVTIWLCVSIPCLVLLLIVGLCCNWKQKLCEITGSRPYQRGRNPRGNGDELAMEEQ